MYSKLVRILLFISLTPLQTINFGCGGEQCKRNYFQTHTNYKVNADQKTGSGIKVDTSGQDISLELIDQLTLEVELCLEEEFPEGKLPREVRIEANCLDDNFESLHRECIQIKIPNNWQYSCDGSQQVLQDEAPQYLCDQKGMSNSACTCNWRAAIQDEYTIIVTPSLYMYKDPLIRIITGCNNPWGHEKLAKCATPSVPKLPAGN